MRTIIINTVVIVVVLCIIAAIVFYLYRQKKRGAKCIGCPYADKCDGKCGSFDDSKLTDKRD